MPGEQKGKEHKKGAGRPRFGAERLKRTHIQLDPADLAYLRALRPDGNVSAAVRDLIAAVQQMEHTYPGEDRAPGPLIRTGPVWKPPC